MTNKPKLAYYSPKFGSSTDRTIKGSFVNLAVYIVKQIAWAKKFASDVSHYKLLITQTGFIDIPSVSLFRLYDDLWAAELGGVEYSSTQGTAEKKCK